MNTQNVVYEHPKLSLIHFFQSENLSDWKKNAKFASAYSSVGTNIS